ncbi:hypothetical protein HPB48_010649 [Haemaphysalis longicornis]|uniref:DDE Tnp4 domain-containing protein n=1 Tax=Haemaphysalis longicornis TaxID=44386 RepID=A0A9J6GDA7_HAELO|nr:hypothetical protein HPB48_010649 [Haemaphysalis longicornis]
MRTFPVLPVGGRLHVRRRVQISVAHDEAATRPPQPGGLYSDDEISFRYRFFKAAVMKMLEVLCLRENSNRTGASLPPLLKLLIALRFYISGAMQTLVGDQVNVSQPTVSNVLWEVTQAVCLRLFPKYVQLPNATEGKLLTTLYNQIGRFPGVTGCIDCTHVQIISPGGDCAKVYRNRKGVFSTNVQAVTGPELQFLGVVASWPGSEHDSRIFENSRVMAMFEASSLPEIHLQEGINWAAGSRRSPELRAIPAGTPRSKQ